MSFEEFPKPQENKNNPELVDFELEYLSGLFAKNPEFAKIGTLESYYKYLDSVFPESVVREIVWHGTISENKVEEFDHNHPHNKKGVTFFGDLKQAKGYTDTDRGDLYAAKINLLNPYIHQPDDAWATDQLQKEHLDSFREAGYDGIIGEGIFGDRERIVFDPGQIHILGSKADLEKFELFGKND